MKYVAIVIFALLLSGCGVAVDDYTYVNERSKQYYEQRGFKVIGYQGYNMWSTGRCYWYTIERDGTIYESCLLKWSGELHEYSLKAVNAIKGTSGK